MTFSPKKSLFVIGILGITIAGFQNCSNVNFEEDPNSPSLNYRFESLSPGDQIVSVMDEDLGVDPVGGDGEKQDQVQDVVDNEAEDKEYDDKEYDDKEYDDKEYDDEKNEDVADQDEDRDKKDDVVKNEDKQNGKKDDVVKNQNEDKKKDRDIASNDDKKKEESNGLVECQLIDSKELVVLAAKFQQQRSNSSKTRVCMSKQACLTLVNAHVAARDGKLVGAKTTEGSQKQCTKEFPGSKGTCNNADALTDAEVAEILASMSN